LEKRKPLPPAEIDVYKNEQLENAVKAGKLEKYKVDLKGKKMFQ
jgi:hypothetical protein